MSERSEYNPGEFCWVDLSSPDTEASAKYYGELLGWKAESAGPVEETGGYGFFILDGKQTAGYGPIMSEGQPPAWSSYVCVADADETVAKVKNAGGTVLFDPVDLPADSGRMAVCQDSGGAVFSIMQPKQHHGAQLVNEVGTWTWNQLSTRDLEGAKKFYGDVFGWTLEKGEGATEDAPYFMWQVDGQKWEEGLGGAMEMGDDFPPEVPSNWLIYVAVENADAAIEKTTGAGGQVMLPVTEIPVGKLAVLTDPQGAALGIIEPDYPEGR